MESQSNQRRTILAVWLPYWPSERWLRETRCTARAQSAPGSAAAADEAAPLVFSAAGQGGLRLVALDRASEAAGLYRGQLVSDARALVPGLQVEEAQPEADRAALERLALWCTRYTPWAAVDSGQMRPGQEGLLLDIGGCGHLFGGDRALAERLLAALAGFGFTAHAALAPTPGAAQALARQGGLRLVSVPQEGLREALAPLELALLRLDPEVVEGLERLGLRRIGDLYDTPRAPLAARFGHTLLDRLDQALGRAGEPISPMLPPIAFQTRLSVGEPVVLSDHLKGVVEQLAGELCRRLQDDDKGALTLRFVACRSDGEVLELKTGMSRPANEPVHVTRLLHEKLDRAPAGLDAGFGFEAFSLSALQVAPRPAGDAALAVPGQAAAWPGPAGASGGGAEVDAADLGHLMDRLGNRLGLARVCRLFPRQSHIPERAVIAVPAVHAGNGACACAQDWRAHDDEWGGWAGDGPHRPLCMLACPEAIEVIAEVPEGAPQRFVWRRVSYAVARADGPERIAAEWWRGRDRATRDYFRLEDDEGRRFWVYRAGLYGRETTRPRWYMHGVFA